MEEQIKKLFTKIGIWTKKIWNECKITAENSANVERILILISDFGSDFGLVEVLEEQERHFVPLQSNGRGEIWRYLPSRYSYRQEILNRQFPREFKKDL